MSSVEYDGVKRKPGRPRIMVRDVEDLSVSLHTTISKRAHDLVPKNIRWKDFIEESIYARFGDRRDAEISALQKKLEELQYEVSRVSIQLAEEKRKKEKEEMLRKALRVEEKYAVRAFRHMMDTLLKTRSSRKSMSLKMEFVQQRWGITFDAAKVNEDYEDFLVRYEAGLVSDQEIASFHVKKTLNGSELEREIKAMIEDELGIS